MRQTTLAFLTFLTVMPLLACFMAFCPMQSAQASEIAPCHEKAADDGMMLVSDCMGIDFFAQALTNDFQPDQQIDTLDFAWADVTVTQGFELRSNNGIRGPPLSADTIRPSQPLYLTTQRLRI